MLAPVAETGYGRLSLIDNYQVASKQDTSTQCWLNIGPASQTLVQHYSDIGSVYRVHYR